jgi:hypothetical protein
MLERCSGSFFGCVFVVYFRFPMRILGSNMP